MDIKNITKANKKYIFFIIFSTLTTCLLCFIYTKIIDTFKHYSFTENTPYINTGNEITINSYNIAGILRYKFTTHNIQHLIDQHTIYFTYPNITILNEKNTTIWKITANQAILNHKKQLFLHGYVHISSLTNHIPLQSIITNHAMINLTTQEITINSTVIIHGNCFYSIGSQMHIHLKQQIAQLIQATQTYYDIKYIS